MHKEKIKALQKELRAKLTAAQAISDLALKEDRGYNETEEAKYKALEEEIEAIEKRLKVANDAQDAYLRSIAHKAPAKPSAKSPEERVSKAYSITRAIGMAAAQKPLDGVELEMHQEAQREIARSGQSIQGIGVPSFMMQSKKRTIEVATAATAGDLVDTVQGDMSPALKPNLVIERAGATVMSGLVGDLDLPVGNALASAAWATEHTQTNETNPSVKTVQLRPKRLTAYTEVSKQIMVQTSDSVETWIRGELSDAIARAVDAAAMNGSGASNQPLGILNAADTHTVALGTHGDALTRAAMLDMITQVAVDNAEVENMGYILTPEMRGFLQNLKTDAGSGLFVWNERFNNMLLGYNAYVSNLMPKTLSKGDNSDCHGLIFGNYQDVILASWGGADIIVDPYTHARKAIIDVVVNSFWDIGIKHGQSFSVIKDARLV